MIFVKLTKKAKFLWTCQKNQFFAKLQRRQKICKHSSVLAIFVIFLTLILRQAYMRWDMDLFSTLGKYNQKIKIKTIIDTGMEKVTTRVDHYKG